MKFGDVGMRKKLIVLLLAIGLVPLAVSGWRALSLSSDALERQATSQLQSVRDLKKTQIERFFTERRGDTLILAETVSRLAGGSLNGAGSRRGDVLSLETVFPSVASESMDSYFKEYTKLYGYYDLFLITPEGDVFYSVGKEADYGTNMLEGAYKDSGLGQLVRQVLSSGSFGMIDFKPYAPSNGDPASFIAAPIRQDGEIALIVGLQVSLEAINSIMQQREGMGKPEKHILSVRTNACAQIPFLIPRDTA